MTREEAIKILSGQEMYYDQNKQFAAQCKATRLAVKSLEAWEKIRKEIASDGQSDINAKYVLNLIDKHLSEVSE